MFRSGNARCGIDLGTTSVKLVRDEGRQHRERITHVGLQGMEAQADASAEERTVQALRTLLQQLGLSKLNIGRIAVSVAGDRASIREVVMPPLTADELAAALPFEARKHLNLEGMSDPVLDAQILGAAPPAEEGGQEQTRVLLAAAPREQREFPVRVLGQVGLEPEVVDLVPLASLNELLASLPEEGQPNGTAALLDLGAARATLHITSREGGFMSRPVGPGRIEASSSPIATYARTLADGVKETLTFYRGRNRKDVGHFYVCGGGALDRHLREALVQALGQPVTVLNPLAELPESAHRLPGTEECGAQFVCASGLCRWWDRLDV